MLMNLFKFKGGVKPPSNKLQSNHLPIAQAPMPSRLVVPLHQSIGGTPRPIVQTGDHVLKGQMIGEADGWISAAVHAPTSGTVLDVAMHVRPIRPASTRCASSSNRTARTSGSSARRSITGPYPGRCLPSPAAMRHRRPRRRRFPAHGKLTPSKDVPMDELIINGAECEPFITCDDLLMRERADEVVRGIAVFRDLLQPKKVLIGIEDNKPEAVAAMRAAVDAQNEPFSVVAVPTLYPAGGAKQLIRVLTGKEVPGRCGRPPTWASRSSTSVLPTAPGVPSPTANRWSRAS
jgi:electron transport complex protein RnfC